MTELSTAEAAVVARFEAGSDAEESLRERVARAIWLASNPAVSLVLTSEQIDSTWHNSLNTPVAREYRLIADAAIATMRGTA